MSVTPIDRTQTIRWNQPPVPREPIRPILDHVLWILKNWRPGEFDLFGNEAYWIVEQLALRLIDCEADRRSVAAVLSEALTMLHDQAQQMDRLRERRRPAA